MLDGIVLIAMAITAVAFAAGLTVQAGLPLLPVLIATMALFLVMAASYVMLGRSPRAGGGGERMDELEEALEIIDGDLQRIDRVEDDLARLDLLSDRVERLDLALNALAPSGAANGQPRTEELAAEFENVYARIESLRAEVEAESRNREKIGNDLGLLEGSIEPASDDLAPAASSAAAVEADTGWDALPPAPPEVVEEIEIEIEVEEEPEPERASETITEVEPEPERVVEAIAEEESERVVETSAEEEPEPKPELEPEIKTEETIGEVPEERKDETASQLDMEEAEAPEAEEAVEALKTVEAEETVKAEEATQLADEPVAAAFVDDDDDDDEDAMRAILRDAVESGRIELYLQPTVTLPERKVRFFEALTRVRTADDDLILPGDYVPVAKRAGMMPLIDNVLLVRSVHALRRLADESDIQGLFCNISLHSLLDPDYFPELVEFMEENSNLSESLIFEVSQPEMMGLTEAELGCLDTLGALGYSFCLDNVADRNVDFAGLSDRYFRYIKISAANFLAGPGRTAADLKRHLDGLGIELIIEKVENESDIAGLLEHGIELAQGYLFDEPKPVDEALSR